MKLVIEISERVVHHVKINYMDISENDYAMICDAVRTATPYEQRPHGEWEHLKEHITEMRDADGELNQKQTCQFILNLMGVIEREGNT